MRLLEALESCGTRLPAEAVAAAVTATRWSGRLDLLTDPRGRQVLCDAAHNPAGARVLADYLREVHPDGLPIVFGIMKDKDVGGTLGPLLPSATRLVLTHAHTDRALSTAALVESARHAGWRGPVDVQDDVGLALEAAWQRAPVVCAAGSLFVIGEVLARLRSDT